MLRYYLLLIIFCLALFGYALIGGRTLTMHEARLPMLAKTMQATGDYLVPKRGDQPWVERPPLPMYLEILITKPLGGINSAWQARAPNVLIGVLAVLLLAAIARRLFDWRTAVIAGFMQATTWEFCNYAWLAEDDIYLCALIYLIFYLFIRIEFPRTADTESTLPAEAANENSPSPLSPLTGAEETAEPVFSFTGKRGFWVIALFVGLGLTNLIKGLAFGTTVALIPLAGYLALSFSWKKIARYVWLYGWIIFLVVAAAWPIACEISAPAAWKTWYYDLYGRQKGYMANPWSYYLTKFPGIMAPWLIFGFVGLAGLIRNFRRDAAKLFFLASWAALTVVILSLSQSKHHHYILAVTGGWAILGAHGWQMLAAIIKRKYQRAKNYPRRIFAGILLVTALVYGIVFSVVYPRTDRVADDDKFIAAARTLVPENSPLFLDGSVDFFRTLFYLNRPAQFVPHWFFIDDERYQLRGKEIFVFTRESLANELTNFGAVEKIAAGENSHNRAEFGGDLALFKLQVRNDLPYHPTRPQRPVPNYLPDGETESQFYE